MNIYIYIYHIFCIYLYAYLIKWYNVFLNHGSKFHSLKLKVTQVLTSPDTDSIQPNPPIDSISDGSTTTHPKKGPHRKTNRESRCFKKMLMHVLLTLDGKPQNKSMSFWDYLKKKHSNIIDVSCFGLGFFGGSKKPIRLCSLTSASVHLGTEFTVSWL